MPDGGLVSEGRRSVDAVEYREPRRSRRQRYRAALDRRLPYLFLLPAAALVLLLVVYPIAWAAWLSLHEVSLVALSERSYLGLGNYRDLLGRERFWTALANTAVFVAASVVGQVGLGLGLALLLERSWIEGRLRRAVRLGYLLPWATTGVVVAYSWTFVFDDRYGLVNRALRWLGVEQPPVWLESVEWALLAVIVANVWRGFPFSVLFQISGLQSLPRRCYEAAAVGGASRWQTARHVTGPLLAPFVAMNVVLVTLFTVTVFDLVYVMTGGRPLHATEVLAVYMYDVAFDQGAFGRASAVAVVLFLVNGAVVGLYLAVAGPPAGEEP